VVSGTIASVRNIPPVAEAGDDRAVEVRVTVTFDGSASRDEDSDIVSYSWNFGDGESAMGVTTSHAYGAAGVYEVTLTVMDDAGDTDTDTLTVTVSGLLPPVIREHSHGSPMLALQATYNEANVHGYAYVDIWRGSAPIEAGQFLEFQVAMFSGNPVFSGTVDLHTSDGSTLGDSDAKDQNDVSAHPSADLSEYARDKWYHRKIPLDALAGKTLDGVMIATYGDEHKAGLFRIYVDNIQITDGEHILTAIYIDEDVIPITNTSTSTEASFVGAEGMSDYSVSIVSATPVTPRGKLINMWGYIKNGRQ
jgi:PKD repeat protein